VRAPFQARVFRHGQHLTTPYTLALVRASVDARAQGDHVARACVRSEDAALLKKLSGMPLLLERGLKGKEVPVAAYANIQVKELQLPLCSLKEGDSGHPSLLRLWLSCEGCWYVFTHV
jgi:hypothetical protein